MSFWRNRILVFVCAALSALQLRGQDKPIGAWESLLPYNSTVGLATDGNTLFTAGQLAFFTCNGHTNEMQTYSKVDGMSDIGLQCISYDLSSATAILAYTNGNIDLFKDNTFYNIPDLKLKVVVGPKLINDIKTDNGYAYVSTSLGVLILDLRKHTIYKLLQLNINNEILPVNSFARVNDYYYMATSRGVFRAQKDLPDLQNPQEWHPLDTDKVVTEIALTNESLYFANKNNVFVFENDTLRKVYSQFNSITHIDGADDNLLISTSSTTANRVMIMAADQTISDSFNCTGKPQQALSLSDGSVWVAASDGLIKRTAKNAVNYYLPGGPTTPSCFDIYAHNKEVWVAHGGFNDIYFAQNNHTGFSSLHNGKWTLYNNTFLNPKGSPRDFVAVLKDEASDILYAGSYMDGLMIMGPDGSTTTLSDNSIFDGSIAYGDHTHQIVDLQFDQKKNLWVGMMYARHQVCLKTPDGNWYKYVMPGARYGGPIAVDDGGQVWMAFLGHGGAAVYNNGGTPGDTTDDKSYLLTTGKGTGNLPSNTTFCIAKDKTNKIWIGSDKGIGVISDCKAPFSATQCEAETPIVKSGPYAGKLLENDIVTTIAVDGGNRKWIGTYNGVYFVSADGDEIIYQYNTDNSPLPSNTIRKISIDDVTGDVYIGTELGMVSFHGMATEGAPDNSEVRVFPNPVPATFSGPIAIRGVTANADVRITDINGQLVFATKAQGGQVIWNAKNNSTHIPATGVYLVFVSDDGGHQTFTGKIVFMQ